MDKGQRGVRGLGSSAKRSSTGVRALNRGVAGGIGAMKRAAVAAIGLGAAYVSITQAKAAITAQNDLAKSSIGLSNTLGLEMETASSWLAVAKSRGIESKALAQSFGILSKNVDAATQGGATQIETFKRLGLTQDDLKRGSQDMSFLLGKVSDGFSGLPKGTERAALGMKLLGRGWQTVFPLLRDGSDSMREQIGLAKEYGATLDDKAAKEAMKLVQAQRELKLAGIGLQLQFAKATTPALLELTEQLTEVGKVMNDPDLTADDKMKAIGDMALEAVDRIGDRLESANFGENLGKAFEVAMPRVAEAAGRGGATFAKSFAKGWWDADIGGKLFVAALLLNKVGVFGFLGKRASAKFIATFAPRLAAALGIEMAATGTVGSAATSGWGKLGGRAGTLFKGAFIVAATIGLYKGLVGPFNQALEDLGLSTNATDPTNGEAQRRADERSGRARGTGRGPGRVDRNAIPHRRYRGPDWSQGGANRIRGAASLKRFSADGLIRIDIHHKTELDGKTIAENTSRHVADAKARQ